MVKTNAVDVLLGAIFNMHDCLVMFVSTPQWKNLSKNWSRGLDLISLEINWWSFLTMPSELLDLSCIKIVFLVNKIYLFPKIRFHCIFLNCPKCICSKLPMLKVLKRSKPPFYGEFFIVAIVFALMQWKIDMNVWMDLFAHSEH